MAQKSIKLADVAREAGVSHGTASNVFSRPDIVREEVRERVHAAAAKLGYSGPSPLGRMLRAGKVNAIGVATAEAQSYFFEDPFARVVMRGISQVCDERGAGISLVSALNSEQLAWNINSALVDGFIVFCLEGGSRLIELTKERKLPFVALDYGFEDQTVHTFGIDDRHGAQLATRHLLDLGHRKFGVLSLQSREAAIGPSTFDQAQHSLYSATRERLLGYGDELQKAGIELTSVPVYETENDTETTMAALDYLFERQPDTTAILSMSDRMALIALDWARARGLRCPDDLSIVGFDGVPETETSQPPLTTIVQPTVEMGRLAATAILDGDTNLSQHKLDISLAVRQSTGPARR